MKTQPRGIRNNNPFNLEKNTGDKWQGLLPEEEQTDPRFCMFESAILGIRAGMRNLIVSQDKHERRTVLGIITAFAPPPENNTESYIVAVCAHMGVNREDTLDMHSYPDLRSMAEAIIEHENGGPWDTWYTETQMTKACVMAGVEPPKKSLAASRQMIGGTITAIATVGVPVLGEVQTQLASLINYGEYIKNAFIVVALSGIVLTMWAKIDERRKGIS